MTKIPLRTFAATVAAACLLGGWTTQAIAQASQGATPERAAQPEAAPVAPVTVLPETQPKGQTIISTDAAPLTSPGYTDKDAENDRSPPLAASVAPGVAVGRESHEPTPVGGLLGGNPDLNAPAVGIGATVVY